MIRSLPEHITIAGIAMQWIELDRTFILKPADGRDYPHVTFIGKTNLNKFHFSSAHYNLATNTVSAVRKGYRWNGMHRRVVDDPEFDEATQILPVTGKNGPVVTFNLSGGRVGQKVQIGAPAVAIPTAAQMANALSLPH